MNNNPLVSVIIPNYCHARYLDERIQSVLNQTYTNFEVIILDDCSPDNGASKEVIEKYRSNPHVTQIVYNETNSGSTFKQWDKGFTLAKGEFIWIAESDDACDEILLESLVNRLLEYPKASVVFCQCLAFISQKGDMGHMGYYNDKDVLFEDFLLEEFHHKVSVTNASCALIRKKCLNKIEKLFVNFRASGDTMFWMELSQVGPIVYSKDGINHFRRHAQNSTNKFKNVGISQREAKVIVDYMISKLQPSPKEVRAYVKDYARTMIFEMVEDKKLKKELYEVWNFSRWQQAELRLEAWGRKLVGLLSLKH